MYHADSTLFVIAYFFAPELADKIDKDVFLGGYNYLVV